ncbi:MAG TPA: MTH938/NDUFAF3 family protein, partial [Gammaproteobacteria bacterium]|nr:MTH938/NDUFAF3 family protein [Gammaproteobacteria bacterium]
TIADLEPALALDPTIIVLGTGTEHLLPDVELMAAVAARSVGLEIMSTPAACRTFNVLLGEQRRVVAALFNPATAVR